MQSTYLVLKTQPSPTRDVFSGPFSISPSTSGLPSSPALNLRVKTAERSEVRNIAAEPDTIAIAPVMPMRLIRPFEVPTNTQAIKAWGIEAVGADTTPYSGEGIVVAVIDTGIDAAHPAFVGVNIVQKDFTGEGNGDLNGHGTHCAGTIFGRPVNGVRIGVAPGVTKALIAKVLDRNGSGSSDAIVKGILWAVDEGANVISISIGMDFPGYVKGMIEANIPADLATSRALEAYRANTQLFDRLSAFVESKGGEAQSVVIVAAAGNESMRELGPDHEIGVGPPAVAVGVVSVGALRKSDGKYHVTDFSNTGPNVAGPGFDILSAAPGGGLRSLSGTSMATPHVAGVAVLWAQKLKVAGRLTGFHLIAKLAGMASPEDMAPSSDAVDYGAGMVQCPQH